MNILTASHDESWGSNETFSLSGCHPAGHMAHSTWTPASSSNNCHTVTVNYCFLSSVLSFPHSHQLQNHNIFQS